MAAHHWGFAGPLLKRLFPSQRDEHGGDEDFEEGSHGGNTEVRSRKSKIGEERLGRRRSQNSLGQAMQRFPDS